MAKNNNLTDFLTDVANAIRAKKGTSVPINPQDFSAEIASIEGGGGSGWTGHADAEGLKAIGWTDEDIAYYQANGVNWNAEDDHLHLVSDDNKALYGVLTADNISEYKDRIVYLPKIDTSAKTSMSYMFDDCSSLVSIPLLDTSNVTNMYGMFSACSSLVTIPQLNTSKVTSMSSMFANCRSLVTIPLLNTANVTSMSTMFTSCSSLTTIPLLNTSKVTSMSNMFYYCYSLVTIPLLNTTNVTNMNGMFRECFSLVGIPQLDTANVTNMDGMFYQCFNVKNIPQLNTGKVTSFYQMFMNCKSLTSVLLFDIQSTTRKQDLWSMFQYCNSLTYASLYGLSFSFDLVSSPLFSKESLLYIINNEAAESAITISLHSYAYERLATDADVVAALAAHPNISLSSTES